MHCVDKTIAQTTDLCWESRVELLKQIPDIKQHTAQCLRDMPDGVLF